MNGNGQRAPREILAEIGRTRGDMDATLNALERRLTPGQLVDQGIDYLKSSGVKEFASNLGGSVRDNPLPVALVGIGLTWLMATGRSAPSTSGASMDDLEGTTEELKGKGEQAMQEAKGKMSSMAQQAKDRFHSARDSAAQVGRTARQTMDKAKGSYDYLLREQPLALGVIGLAVGALFAAAAPRTEEEDESASAQEKEDALPIATSPTPR